MTDRQQATLEYFREYDREQGVPPTVRDVANRFRISIGAARNRMIALVRAGEVVHGEHGAARTYRLRARTCPHCGKEIA